MPHGHYLVFPKKTIILSIKIPGCLTNSLHSEDTSVFLFIIKYDNFKLVSELSLIRTKRGKVYLLVYLFFNVRVNLFALSQ